jgi:EmrB/QacA subfamily drug resistance transporter
MPSLEIGQDETPEHRGGAPRHLGWTLAATILASSLGYIEGVVINVALADIGHDLQGTASDLQWTINAYLLPLSALILVGGAAGDRFGRRRMLVVGTALFGLASIACALAPNLTVLLWGRAIQGIGAAMLLPNSLGILGAVFEGETRARAIGTWAAAGAIASTVGPPLGGWLIADFGWRAIFYINLPVAAAAILIAVAFVEESSKGRQPLDGSGAAFATLALGTLTWALTLWSSRGRASAEVCIGLVAAIVLLMGFLLVEHKKKKTAMMPLSLFASRPFVGLSMLTFLLYMALSGLIVLVPYVLIIAGGATALQAGMSLLPVSIAIGLLSRPMGRLADRIGPKWPLTVAPVVAAGGYLLLSLADPQASYFVSILPGITLIAFGMAGAVAPLTTAVLSSVDTEHTGTASGFNNAIARTGMLIAVALVGAVLAQFGPQLVASFHTAAIVGALLAAASGGIALVTLPGNVGRSRGT